jgi:hypothetical protein
MHHLDEGTVVTVRYPAVDPSVAGVDHGTGAAIEIELNCVVIGVLPAFVQLLPVTPARAPAIGTLVELSSGPVRFRATVQDSSNDLFSVLRPVDVPVGQRT